MACFKVIQCFFLMGEGVRGVCYIGSIYFGAVVHFLDPESEIRF